MIPGIIKLISAPFLIAGFALGWGILIGLGVLFLKAQDTIKIENYLIPGWNK